MESSTGPGRQGFRPGRSRDRKEPAASENWRENVSLSENKVVIKSKSCREGLNIFLSADYLADDQADWRLASLVPFGVLLFVFKFSRVGFLVGSRHRTGGTGGCPHGQRDGAGGSGIQGEAHGRKRHVAKDGRDTHGETPGRLFASSAETAAGNLWSTNWSKSRRTGHGAGIPRKSTGPCRGFREMELLEIPSIPRPCPTRWLTAGGARATRGRCRARRLK